MHWACSSQARGAGPQISVFGLNLGDGHPSCVPSQYSGTSHTPADGRQTTPASFGVGVGHIGLEPLHTASFEQTAPNWHTAPPATSRQFASQQEPDAPLRPGPRSHCSPPWMIWSPQTGIVVLVVDVAGPVVVVVVDWRVVVVLLDVVVVVVLVDCAFVVVVVLVLVVDGWVVTVVVLLDVVVVVEVVVVVPIVRAPALQAPMSGAPATGPFARGEVCTHPNVPSSRQ